MLSVDYIAGFIDADGCIMLAKNGNRYTAKVSIANTNEGILLAIQYTLAMWDIKCVVGAHTRKLSRCKTLYQLNVTSNDSTYKVCQYLVHHLTLKQQNAKLLLEYLDIRRVFFRSHMHVAREEKIYDEIKQLNKRGLD